MAEPKSRFDIVLREMAVVDRDAFCVVDLRVRLRLGNDVGLRIVTLLLSDGIHQAARGVDLPVEDINESGTELLAGEVGPENGCDVWMVDPFLRGGVNFEV